MQILDRDINVIIKYKNIKHVYFRVDSDNNLVVSAPTHMLEGEVRGIILKKGEDICALYDRQSAKNVESKKFKYLGVEYSVKYLDNIPKVGFKDGVVYAPSEEVLEKFWFDECAKVFAGEANICRKCFATLPEYSIKVRKMRTRWGVCNIRKKQITLNSELLKYTLPVIDYVIIHEMCHFFEANHSRDFWNLVEAACPNYNELKGELKK
ncbi:MAG: SprT-like domain-containing protein [bacterium]